MATKQLPESRLGSSPRNTRPTSPPARRKNVPLSPLALKMQADLQLAGLGERTQESYLRSVRTFAQWLKRAPRPSFGGQSVAFASGKAAQTANPRRPPLDGCHWSLVIGHW
jgi:hypothetical protein